MPSRVPAGLPANFKGVSTGAAQLAGYIQDRAGGVPFSPVGNGVGSLRLDRLPGKIIKGIKGFLGFDSYDAPEKPNKFTLRGCVNFTGRYPAELVAQQRDLR